MAITSRQGPSDNLDKNKLVSGEDALTLDKKEILYCVGPGDVRELVTTKNVNDLLTKSPELYDKLQMLVGKLENETLLQGILGDISQNTTNIAQNIADIDANASNLTTQLAKKASQVDVRLKAIPLEQTDLSDTLKAQIAGTAGVNVTPQNIGVTREKIASKSVGYYNTDYLDIGKNKFNKDTVTTGYWVNYTNGNVEVSANYCYSDYIPIKNIQYIRKVGGAYSGYYYDSAYNKISGFSGTNPFTPPSNAVYVRVNIATSLIATEQIEEGSVSTSYEFYGIAFKYIKQQDLVQLLDTYPFQPLVNFNFDVAMKNEIRKAVKKIEIFGADFTKKYCLGIIQRNFSTYGTGAYIYECDVVTGATTKIVAMTSKISYTEPSGIDVFDLAEYQSSGITAKIYVDWSQITTTSQYVNTHYDKSGLDIRTYNNKQFNDNVKINLPSKLYAVIGDTLEIFYKGIIQAVNPFNYNIKVVSTKGNAYSKRYIYTPIAGDTDFTVTFSIYNNNNELMATKAVIIVVSAVKSNPASIKNVLCVGDSLLSDGTWAKEMKRRLADTGGLPVGNGLSNIKFIGSLKNTVDSTVRYEGYGGWNWQNYNSNLIPLKYWITVTSGMKTDTLNSQSVWSDGTNQWQLETIDIPNSKLKFKQYPSGGTYAMSASGTLTFVSGGGNTTSIVYSDTIAEAGNPFWNISTSKLDFVDYCIDIVATQIDYAYILLGWNNTSLTKIQLKVEVKKFIDQLHIDYPSCKVALCGLEVPSIDGLGANYGANTDWNYYEKLQKVFEINDAYYEISQDVNYSAFVDFVNIASQFDTENNMPTSTRPLNARNATTETYGTNGVHPANSGYMQIADTNYRHIMSKL